MNDLENVFTMKIISKKTQYVEHGCRFANFNQTISELLITEYIELTFLK